MTAKPLATPPPEPIIEDDDISGDGVRPAYGRWQVTIDDHTESHSFPTRQAAEAYYQRQVQFRENLRNHTNKEEE